MSEIDDIHAALKAGRSITPDEAVIYAQHHIFAEREACAKLADAEVKGPDTEVGKMMDFVARSIANAIRNRKT